MSLVEQKLNHLLKPLHLEQKQGFLNRSVVGGLDSYILERFDKITQQLDLSASGESGLKTQLLELRRSFSQYMTLSRENREKLVLAACDQINAWTDKPPQARPVVSTQKLSLTDTVYPFISRDKTRAFQLTRLKTVEDLLYYGPKWALHANHFKPIAQCANLEEPAFILARINGVAHAGQWKRETMKVTLEDGSGHLSWIWYNRPFLKKEMVNGRWVVLHESPQSSKWGKQVVGKGETFEFLLPEEEKALREGKVVVMYPSTPTLNQAFWRSTINAVLGKYETLLRETGDKTPGNKLSLADAILGIHRPETLEQFEESRKRLAYDELLLLQSFFLLKRREIERREKGRQYQFEGGKILQFRKSIPYQLTGAQKKVLKEIRGDLAKPYPMNRLLQGDVGSGKTLVAAISFLYAADSGVQSAFMAPTEILAQQHYQTLTRLLEPLGMKTLLFTGGMRAKAKREALAALKSGEINLAVGTHALLEEDIQFQNLGFLVIDERHKFGVLQRAALEEKGKWPDCLMMTATPFPRALVLTEYGDTDLSVLDEFPKGRKAIQTFWKSESRKEEVYDFVRARLLKGEQAFWVFPVVEESKIFLKSAILMHKYFEKEIFHGFRMGLLHGKMKKEEKDRVMAAFLKKEYQLLVSTTVVEVGVDISNATVMVVEHSERFGLAQLHQLRGRVGRGEAQSYCFLVTSPLISSEAVERTKIMVSTLDGFKLSEFDLKMRGPGEIFGVAQSGRREGGIVDLKRDVDVVEEARKDAQALVAKDPGLVMEANRFLRTRLESRYQTVLNLAQIS